MRNAVLSKILSPLVFDAVSEVWFVFTGVLLDNYQVN